MVHPVLFFLGAGASVGAGVPPTEPMVDKFLESLKTGSAAHETLKEILARLRRWSGESSHRPVTDIELLLQVLERLRQPYEDPLTLFFSDARYDLATAFSKANLIQDLRNFIKKICLVGPSTVDYLRPLNQFLLEARPIRVFTVNYDTVVEQFCSEFRLDYSDGFDLEWNPTALERADLDIQLFKLHGSITWYETDQGKYIKLPVFVEGDEVQLFTRETARSLMIYPAQKSPQNEPLLRILLELRRSLDQADIAIVSGYSFRDPHIVQMFWEAARQNRSLLIVLVSPSAFRTYKERLENYHPGAPSSIKGRVVPLPFLWENALPHLKSTFLANIRLARKLEDSARNDEMAGEKVDWSPACLAWARGGNYEGAEGLYNKSGFPNSVERVEVAHNLWMMAKLGGTGTSRQWGDALMLALNGMSPKRLRVGQVEAKLHFSISFDGEPELKWSFDDAFAAVKLLLQCERTWSRMLSDAGKPLLGSAIDALQRVMVHLETWQKSPDTKQIGKLAIPEQGGLVAELREKVEARVIATALEDADWRAMERAIYEDVVRLETTAYESVWEALRTAFV